MVSFEVRQTLTVAARLFVVAVVAVPYFALSQPVFEPGANDTQRQLVEKIRAAQAQDGPYSLELLQPLMALSLFYRESGEHGLATAAIERALQVIRANYGVHSLDQAPLIRQWIRSEEARGNFTAAWDLEQALLTLVRRHPDDLRTVPILREIGDKRMEVLERYVAGEFPPQFLLGCYYDPREFDDAGGCHSGSRDVAVQSILAEAQKDYADAISVILRSELYSSDELRELEMELLRSSYQHGGYDVGKQSLRRLIAYDVANSVPWLTRMDALIQMADWDLLFAPNGSALETYEEVYDLLRRRDAPQVSIDAVFSPLTPVVIPAFLPNPLVSKETPESTGYIDVAFDVSKYGRSLRVEILDTTTNATNAAKDRLVRLILRSRFRPRVIDGQFGRTPPIVVRYYVNEPRDRS